MQYPHQSDDISSQTHQYYAYSEHNAQLVLEDLAMRSHRALEELLNFLMIL